MHSKFSVQLACVSSVAEGHPEISTVMKRWFPKVSEDKTKPLLYHYKGYWEKNVSECNRERLWRVSVHLGWEVHRNRVLTGFWSSACLWLVFSEMRNCGRNAWNVQTVQTVFHSLVTECVLDMYSCLFYFFFFLMICLPLTPTVVSHNPWDYFAPRSPDAPIFRERF